MQRKIQAFSNFSRAINTSATTVRPDKEEQLNEIFNTNHRFGILARGNGLSYSDCCVNHEEMIIDTRRLNHILSFDPLTGIAVCQGAVTFADLFSLDPQFIPPVLPGTLYATLAGGIANDIHGKNNPHAGSLGQHIEWLELQLGHQSLHCSRSENAGLFNATIAGLGLTGIIKRVAIRLHKASHMVTKKTEKFSSFPRLLQHMQHEGMHHDYQVAWLDLLNKPSALLSFANHVETANRKKTYKHPTRQYRIPKLPFRLVNHYLMKQFNKAFYHQSKTDTHTIPLWQFNNPLDEINDWNRLYGRNGLLQFQAVFAVDYAHGTLDTLIAIIQSCKATPTLAVLKYFTEAGTGLLSFVEPGFTIAIDFINNTQARRAIAEMNQYITTLPGKVYLAKDLFLTREQFNTMYPRHEEFSDILTKYNSPMSSCLGRRLGIGIERE
jgi:FAD/FMN-containing dehydrogenase